MPIFTLIQAAVGRIIIVIVAILAVFGLGSMSNSPTDLSTQEAPIQKIEGIVTPIEEILLVPQKIVRFQEEDSVGNTEENKPEVSEKETPAGADVTIEVPPIDSEIEILTDPPIVEMESPLSFSQINTETAEALVNILCSQNVAGAVTPITGSGVVIDSRGVVITNAHVAQFFLLKDFPTENSLQCVLRTGSPARTLYTAELLYISPEWVHLHANDIGSLEPRGTGEHDYAFLRITGRTDPNAKLPANFSFVSIDVNDRNIKVGNQTLVAAYPAGFLGSISIQRDLYSVSSIATVRERFTFLENTIDLFSIGGTVVSQGGSSGGAVVSDKNKLIGIIVTSTEADTTAERDLRAITLGHINRALLENSNTTIEGLLFGDIVLRAKLFNFGIAPTLTALYNEYLAK